MFTRTKVLGLMIAALSVLTLVPGAPFGYASLGYARDRQDRPTTAAPRMRISRIQADSFDSQTNDPPNLPIRCSPPPMSRATRGDANVVGMKEAALSFVQETLT